MDETRRPATVEDCHGCLSDKFNTEHGRCWSLVHARMVPRWRIFSDTGGEQAVLRPQCYMEHGFTYRAR